LCDTGQHPNGSDADPVLDNVSHEHKEMIDDPLGWQATQNNRVTFAPPLAWFGFRGESDDKCAGYYGPTQTNGVGAYNQVINGHDYLLQAEWSNALAQPQGFGCVTNGVDQAPTAAFSASAHGAVARLDASASADPDPGDAISSYFWTFGDGTSAPTGPTTTHTFPAAGTYRVVLYVTDTHGATASAQHDVTVAQPDPTRAFQANLTEYLDDRGAITGGGNATRLGVVGELGTPVFDFSNFPASIGVSAEVQLFDRTDKDFLFFHYHVTLSDAANPPQGNNYNLTGSWSIEGGIGAVSNAFGAGTITGTCTSSFTSDIAQCTDTWTGTIGPP
jgi:PKD repeat protein